MIKMAYYNDYIRCYSDGRIERLSRKNQYDKNPIWREVTQTNFGINGYLHIGIDGKNKLWHRVVWEAFNGEIPKGMTINHKDEIKTNNSLSNLEVMTIGDNVRYGTGIKRCAEKRRKPVVGINIKTGEEIEFPSMMEAESHGFSNSNICACIKGRRKTAYGYKWFYKE